MKIMVLHASMYGHTAVLAQAVADGARQVSGAEVALKSVDDCQPDELKTADAIIWGSSGYFGVPNPKMANFLAKLGQLWFTGGLQGKVGGVFGSTSTQHGGIENLLRALQAPLQHLGLTIVPSTGQLNEERLRFACPYGASAVIPVETAKDAPMNKPNESEMKLAVEYGKLVAETAAKLARMPVHA